MTELAFGALVDIAAPMLNKNVFVGTIAIANATRTQVQISVFRVV